MRDAIRKMPIILSILFCSATVSIYSSFHFESIFSSEKDQIDLAFFVDNVLRQFSSKVVIGIINKIMREKGKNNFLDDSDVYEQLLNKIAPLRTVFDPIRVIQLLNFQKAMLKKDLEKLLRQQPTFNNCLEIGTPGTYLSTLSHRIKGNVYAILERQSITDSVQAFSFNPFNGFKYYNDYFPLGNYDPISEIIPNDSIDLVVCTIGLHHCPAEKLDEFVRSIKRVLRPGGVFLLREHNAHTKKLVSLAYAAHSVFNVIIAQETKNAETAEVRNFQSLAYWKNLLASHGFLIGSQEYLQKGDSTLNTLIMLTKECKNLDDHILDANIKAQQVAGYKRDSIQTYLTTPEWNNVDAAQHYGNFINKIPFYEFPYMEHVKIYWQTFFKSWKCAAKEKGGNLKLLLSPNVIFNYALMNLFIGTVMTVEHCAKSLVSLPVRAIFSGAEATELLVLVHDPDNEILSLDPEIMLKEDYESALKLVSIPRYMQFLQVMKKLKSSNITIVKIANNDSIVCKIRYKKNSPCSLKKSWIKKFTWQMPTVLDYEYAAYLVPVADIKDFISAVEDRHVGEVLYIHDF